jgi:hypothetical protein
MTEWRRIVRGERVGFLVLTSRERWTCEGCGVGRDCMNERECWMVMEKAGMRRVVRVVMEVRMDV